jgi:hypothetical protein
MVGRQRLFSSLEIGDSVSALWIMFVVGVQVWGAVIECVCFGEV